MVKQLLCFAEGRGDQWEAICVDLDLAVQGRSFPEVQDSLNAAIVGYLRSVGDEDEATRRQLLNRRAPLLVRLRYAWRFLRASVLHGGPDDRSLAGYQTARPA